MKIDIESTDVLEVPFEEFKLFYPNFNSGQNVLWFKEREEDFVLLAFIDNAPVASIINKNDILVELNVSDLLPETVNQAIENWRQTWLKPAHEFNRYGCLR